MDHVTVAHMVEVQSNRMSPLPILGRNAVVGVGHAGVEKLTVFAMTP